MNEIKKIQTVLEKYAKELKSKYDGQITSFCKDYSHDGELFCIHEVYFIDKFHQEDEGLLLEVRVNMQPQGNQP